MSDRTATVRWTGDLVSGSGTIRLTSSGAGEFAYSLPTRAGDPDGQTGPEELLAAAHAACYSMQLSALLTAAGTPPTSLDSRATVTQRQQGDAYPITDILLVVRAVVPGCDADRFGEIATQAKDTCPVSVALAGPDITLQATLEP